MNPLFECLSKIFQKSILNKYLKNITLIPPIKNIIQNIRNSTSNCLTQSASLNFSKISDQEKLEVQQKINDHPFLKGYKITNVKKFTQNEKIYMRIYSPDILTGEYLDIEWRNMAVLNKGISKSLKQEKEKKQQIWELLHKVESCSIVKYIRPMIVVQTSKGGMDSEVIYSNLGAYIRYTDDSFYFVKLTDIKNITEQKIKEMITNKKLGTKITEYKDIFA